jgi:uncharacterized protein (DUF58 family)
MPVPQQTPTRFLDPEVLRALRSIELVARLLVEGMYASRHRCPAYGFSVEFKDHREYAPGDEPRTIDWKTLARTERYYVRRFEMESNMNVVPVLDASASMGYRPAAARRLTKLEYGCYLGASLAYLAARQQDSPGLVLFDRDVRVFLPPRQGQRHLFHLLTHLDAVQPAGETDLAAALRTISLRLRRRSIFVLITDAHGDEARTVEAVKQLAARGHELVVFHLLDQDEVEFPFQMLASFRDLETGRAVMCDPLRQKRLYEERLAAFRGAIREGSLAAGADYRFLHTGLPIEAVLREYLLYRRRRG